MRRCVSNKNGMHRCKFKVTNLVKLLSVPGTMKVHAVSPVCSEFIMIRNMSCYCQGCNNNLSDRACDGWSKCRISKQSTELETNKNRRDTQLEPQVHAEIENQGNENDSSNAENRWQTVDIDELDFVAAVYDGKWYLGKVITIDDEDDEAKINFMEQCPGKIVGIYRWPNPPVELWFFLSDILKRIPELLNFGFLCRTYLKGYLNC
jgi:hypothetical protein